MIKLNSHAGMGSDESAIQCQIERCHMVLNAFSRCLREQCWQQVNEKSGRVNREMELLRMSFVGYQQLDGNLAGQVCDLQKHLKELQHQLAMHTKGENVNTGLIGSAVYSM